MKVQFLEVGPKKANIVMEATNVAGVHAILRRMVGPNVSMLPTDHPDVWQLKDDGKKAGLVKILTK